MKKEIIEEWIAIPEFENYHVSSGRVKRFYKNFSYSREIFGSPDKDGYIRVVLCSRTRLKGIRIHVLVCEIFHGPKPSPHHQVAHNDGIRNNNYKGNLRWATSKENHLDRKLHGTYPIGDKNPTSKITEEQAKIIKLRIANGEKLIGIARELDISHHIVYNIKSGNSWAWLA